MNRQDFERVIADHRRLIHKVTLTYCHDDEERRDLAQEIVVQLWHYRERYDPQYAHSTWIYRIAINVAISAYRYRSRRQGRETTLDEATLESASTDVDEQRQRRALLRHCLAQLRPLDRALVMLHLEGQSHAVIAEILGTSPSNVSTKMVRIKQRMREMLNETAAMSGQEQARKEHNNG